MPWQSSRAFRPVERTHYTARCSDCGAEAEVCVRRMPAGPDAEIEAVQKFQRGGWHVDGLAYGGRKPRDGRWICPKCSKLERRS